MKLLFALCASLLMLCLLSISSVAQSTSATLSGVVVDTSDRVIVDAEITILNDATGMRFDTRTNRSGIYTVSTLPPGGYRVQVMKPGFKTIIKPGVTLNVQSAVALNFTLPLGAASESVTVEGGTSEINTTDGSVSTVVDRGFVENMPLNGRSFQDLLTLAPGVAQVANGDGAGYGAGYSGDIVVNGQRTESNYFSVDGVTANTGTMPGKLGEGAGVSGSLPGLSALGTTQGLASIDTLQEFRAMTSTYSAEYGRSPGGQFSFSTRSGTNDLHGSVYDYFRNDALDASNWFNDYYGYPKGKERQNDFGGTFAGPIMLPALYDGRKKSFFFFSYEGLRLVSPQAATPVEVPDDSIRQAAPAPLQPLLNAFPIADDGEDGNDDGFGYYLQSVSYPSALNNTSVRLDHSFGEKLSIFGRYADTPSDATSYLAAIRQSTSEGTRTATLGATATFSPRQSNDLRFNFTETTGSFLAQSTDLGGATPFLMTSIPGPGSGSFPAQNSELLATFTFANFTGINLQDLPDDQHQLEVDDTHNWLVGSHYIKVGFDWRRLLTHLPAWNPVAEYGFRSESQVLTNEPSIVAVELYGTSHDVPVYQNFSGFAQDEWKASPRLSLSFGLRWDINPAPTNSDGPNPWTLDQISNLATAQLAPAGTPLWRTDWLGFAPRIGIAYQLRPNSPHNTVFRTGFGIFYDPGNTTGSVGYEGLGFVTNQILPGASFPLTSAQLSVPQPSIAAPYSNFVTAFDPNLKMPYSLQYSAAIEQAISRNESMTLSYVASGGRKLLTEFYTYPAAVGNTYFGAGTEAFVIQGHATSNYNSLQAKYQRTLSRGLQALVGYTWSHSIDDSSNNFYTYYLFRASSDFDVRQNLQAAVTYAIPRPRADGVINALLGEWGIDLRFQAQTALPIDIIGSQEIDVNTGQYVQYRANRVAAEPLYLKGSQYPGKKVINYNAFAIPADGVNGNLPRNDARGFGTTQLDLAIRKDISIHDRFHVQLRAEAFNIANHPMFGPVYNALYYGPSLFGFAYGTFNTQGNLNSLYQVGGPRSLQLSLKASF